MDISVATMPGCVRAAGFFPIRGDHRHHLIAVDDLAALVDDEHAIGVAVERDADVGAHFAHFVHERRRRRRAHVAVDVEAVRLDADLEDFRAEFP